jgi:hypothetical protein
MPRSSVFSSMHHTRGVRLRAAASPEARLSAPHALHERNRVCRLLISERNGCRRTPDRANLTPGFHGGEPTDGYPNIAPFARRGIKHRVAASGHRVGEAEHVRRDV